MIHTKKFFDTLFSMNLGTTSIIKNIYLQKYLLSLLSKSKLIGVIIGAFNAISVIMHTKKID